MTETYLRCKAPQCNKTPGNITARMARARLEYRLRHDPISVYKFSCDKCKKTSTYSLEEIVALIPPDDRPKPLPHDYFWAHILYELAAWKNPDHRAFFGSRVLVQRLLTESDKNWYGMLKSTSPYAPTLEIGNYVRGGPRSNYELCLFVVVDGKQVPIPRPEQIPRSISFGTFVSPRDNDNELLCANLACSNPICNHIFSTMTFTRFQDAIAREQLDEAAFDEVTFMPTLTLECPVCGTCRVIDESSFEGLFKERD